MFSLEKQQAQSGVCREGFLEEVMPAWEVGRS